MASMPARQDANECREYRYGLCDHPDCTFATNGANSDYGLSVPSLNWGLVLPMSILVPRHCLWTGQSFIDTQSSAFLVRLAI